MDMKKLEAALCYRMNIYDLNQDRLNIKSETAKQIIWDAIRSLEEKLLNLEVELFFSHESKLDARVLNASRRSFGFSGYSDMNFLQRMYEADSEEIGKIRNIGKKALERIELFKQQYGNYLAILTERQHSKEWAWV